MKKKDILDQSLPKWPALLVVGDKVTQEQAWEIIIRTTKFGHMSTNDHSFRNKIIKFVFGVESTKDGYNMLSDYFGGDWNKAQEAEDALNKRINSIAGELEYLENEQIASSWIGGAHGWCDWHGNIFTNNYNIGKWPSCGTVYNEWKVIAKAFPFLNLRSQLLSGETCEDDNQPIIEFVVKGGKVSVKKPKSILGATNKEINLNFMKIGGERGCSFEEFVTAFSYVLKDTELKK